MKFIRITSIMLCMALPLAGMAGNEGEKPMLNSRSEIEAGLAVYSRINRTQSPSPTVETAALTGEIGFLTNKADQATQYDMTSDLNSKKKKKKKNGWTIALLITSGVLCCVAAIAA